MSPSPLTFTLFPLLQKALLQEVYCVAEAETRSDAIAQFEGLTKE
ncbi:hypothetical protein [Nostoc sp. GT001]|nr:hypothetical protein [Nostoc sp. GT001]MDM9584288.1 hypothetical protein [Nostoc sp. GT001]